VAFTRRPISRGRETGARRVSARFRRAGHRFGAVQDIGPNAGSARLAAAVAPNGRGYVAWGTQDLGEEANQPFHVHAAVKPAGPRPFRAATLLDPGGGLERPVGTVSIAVAPDASATVAWSGVRVTRIGTDLRFSYPVRAAATDPAGRFGAAQHVAGGNGATGGVALDATGAATVVWTAMTPGELAAPTAVLAARRPPGATVFGPAETVTDHPPGVAAAPPAIAADPVSGRPVVVWPGRGGLLVSARVG
jgi:hypothetical protein